MDSVKITSDNVRLDQVVNRKYGDLKMFDDVVEANDHITTVIIPKGTIVYLPEKPTKPVQEDDILW